MESDVDGKDQEPHEMKYVPVKTEIEDMEPPAEAHLIKHELEDDDEDHFLCNNTSAAGNEGGDHDASGGRPNRTLRIIVTSNSQDEESVCKKKQSKRGGARKQNKQLSRLEKYVLNKKHSIAMAMERLGTQQRREKKQKICDLVPENDIGYTKENPRRSSRCRLQITEKFDTTVVVERNPVKSVVKKSEGKKGNKYCDKKPPRKVTIKTDDADEVLNDEKNNKEKDGTTTKRKDSTGTSRWSVQRRKRIAEMTQEERAASKAKRSEQWRRQVERMTHQQREERLRKQRERNQKRRALELAKMTEEEIRMRQERKRMGRPKLTPEERNDREQKRILAKIEKQAKMTEDEKNTRKMNLYMQRMARMASVTPEQRKKKSQQSLDNWRRRKETMTADDFEQLKEKRKCRKEAMTPEKRARYLERQRESWKKRYKRMKEDPVKWEKFQEKCRRDRLKKQKRLEEMGLREPLGEGRRKRRFYQLKGYPNETPKEREARFKDRKRKLANVATARKRRERRLAMRTLLDSGVSPEAVQQQFETPEQRARRLERMEETRKKFQQRLDGMVIPPEETEQRLGEQIGSGKLTTDTCKPVATSKHSKKKDSSSVKKELGQSKTSIFKKPTKTEKGGKGSKNQQQNCINEDNHAGSTTQITTVVYPPFAPTNFYVSIPTLETSELLNYPCHSHQQIQQPQQKVQSITNQYNQQYDSLVPAAPQCSQQQLQTQYEPYSLQRITEVLTLQVSETTTASFFAGDNGSQASHQEEDHTQYVNNHSSATSYHDHPSSYDDDDTHSPASSPECPQIDADNHCASAVHENLPCNRSSVPSSTDSTTRRKPGRPRRGEPPPRPKERKGTRKHCYKNITTGVICDECGNMYSKLQEHKLHFHNPNYKDKKCQLCGKEFGAAKLWYQHYLQVHLTPSVTVKERSHMCDICGQAFREKLGLDKHKYYKHGDGQKKENFKKCPLCPGEKLIKTVSGFDRHMNKQHPGYNKGGHACYRCSDAFPDERLLSLHVQQEHPTSYFPCQYCNACKFTKFALDFHYCRCPKATKEMRDKMVGTGEINNFDRESLPCKICGRKVTVFSFRRHFMQIHGVKEDDFVCSECGKRFKCRNFWAVHMEEKHTLSLERVKDLVRCLNVKSRDGLVIQNVDGAKRIFVRPETVTKGAKAKKKKASRKAITGNDHCPVEKTPGKRRKVIVIAEEDEKFEREESSEQGRMEKITTEINSTK